MVSRLRACPAPRDSSLLPSGTTSAPPGGGGVGWTLENAHQVQMGRRGYVHSGEREGWMVACPSTSGTGQRGTGGRSPHGYQRADPAATRSVSPQQSHASCTMLRSAALSSAVVRACYGSHRVGQLVELCGSRHRRRHLRTPCQERRSRGPLPGRSHDRQPAVLLALTGQDSRLTWAASKDSRHEDRVLQAAQ